MRVGLDYSSESMESGQKKSSERFLSPSEVGKIFNVTGEAVKYWIHQRSLRATRQSNGYWKIKVSDVEEFLRVKSTTNNARIVITHTNSAEIQLLADAVATLGYKPVLVRKSADALLSAKDDFPAMFIVDVSGNRKESWNLAKKVRQNRSRRKVPIIIVSTADLDESEALAALRVSAQAFIRLPANLQHIKDEISRLL